jgi:hypothetical protein
LLLGLHTQQREDTGLSPAEAVFGAPIVLPNEFLQGDEISIGSILRIFQKLWMRLLFLCPGTIPAPICPADCQPSSSPPASSGSGAAAPSRRSRPFSAALSLFCARDPAPSPSESGRGTRSSLSVASRPPRPRTPSLAVRVATADCRVSFLVKQVSFSDPMVSSPSSSAPP